jgi:hypothetical protein
MAVDRRSTLAAREEDRLVDFTAGRKLLIQLKDLPLNGTTLRRAAARALPATP